ncbi:hypothetical protein L6164_016654 [Bauhinia variegata]|uniref:Uncharacterized protein n=1 Tax=Bauhinia variegata TaxID=167791 RepID=A0ACB9NQE3_BAUVA|nr:hypothetical protein L6164_016654 [Bauhinia variegata]
MPNLKKLLDRTGCDTSGIPKKRKTGASSKSGAGEAVTTKKSRSNDVLQPSSLDNPIVFKGSPPTGDETEVARRIESEEACPPLIRKSSRKNVPASGSSPEESRLLECLPPMSILDLPRVELGSRVQELEKELSSTREKVLELRAFARSSKERLHKALEDIGTLEEDLSACQSSSVGKSNKIKFLEDRLVTNKATSDARIAKLEAISHQQANFAQRYKEQRNRALASQARVVDCVEAKLAHTLLKASKEGKLPRSSLPTPRGTFPRSSEVNDKLFESGSGWCDIIPRG